MIRFGSPGRKEGEIAERGVVGVVGVWTMDCLRPSMFYRSLGMQKNSPRGFLVCASQLLPGMDKS